MTNEQETALRQQFEKWVEANGPIGSEITYRDITTGQYILYSTQLAWEAWQESARQAKET